MRVIKYRNREFTLHDKSVERIYEKIITPFGSGAKIDAPKEFIGRRVYVVILQ